VGEIGGAFVDPATVEIGYAVVDSLAGNGFATAAVSEFAALARDHPSAERLLAHTPADRPASSRVLVKAGFASLGEVEDEHEGETLVVEEWELPLG
jgi:[ribosomal protein S5]-alanine N-acetyltransferase